MPGSTSALAPSTASSGTAPLLGGRAKLLGLLLALPVIGVFLFVVFRPVLVLPRIGPAPGYVLTDAMGRRVSHEDFRGQVVLYTFATTNCTTECQDTYALIREVDAWLRENPFPVPLSFVTVYLDGDRATPAVLQEVAAQQGLEMPNWYLLSGEEQALKYMVGGGFEIYYRRDETDAVQFRPGLVLVDGVGILRAIYRDGLPTLEEVQRDLGILATEIEHSKGLTRYAYEAAHLFLCYP